MGGTFICITLMFMLMPNHNFKISLLFAFTSNKFYIFKGVKGQKLGKNGLNQAERWENIHFSSCVWPAAAVICSAAGAGSWWWMLNEAVSAWCICCRIKWELDSAWYRGMPGPMLHKNWPRPILHWYSTRSWYHLAPPGVARNNSNYPASNDN